MASALQEQLVGTHQYHEDTIASEVLSAALGGAISSAALYPLEVIKTRMQAAGDDDDILELSDGVHDSEKEEDTMMNVGDMENKTTANRKHNTKNKKMNMVEFASDLYRKEGLKIFFQGMEISAFGSAMQKACYFCAYSALKQLYMGAVLAKHQKRLTTTSSSSSSTQSPTPPSISPLTSVILGCLAEWAHLPLTLPIDALTTALQTSPSSASTMRSGSKAKTTQSAMALLMTMWREDTVYKGIQAYYILCFKPALQYSIYEQLKRWILSERKRPHQSSSPQQLSASESFALGMFARTVATLFVFPFVRAKVRMQSSSLSSSPSSTAKSGETNCGSTTNNNKKDSSSLSTPSSSIWQLLQTTYATGGIASLYQGIGPELTRGVLSAALMMMVKEQISGGVKKVMYG
jgi:adenine nucleotide transporter 17